MFHLVCLSAVLALAPVQVSNLLSTDDPAVQKEILNLINNCRKNVDPPASNMVKTTWRSEAQQNAHKVAQSYIFAHSDQPRSKTSIFHCWKTVCMVSYTVTCSEAIPAFCNEKKAFVYEKGPTEIPILAHGLIIYPPAVS
ncbi:cysteine-rich secretory protein 1-like isoform X1 [Pseudophryne corroboree]|uniref:cysteine-rich secretory protein 1-like isoform X1 n=1 Tax=Pseudophryne corroboree TaxID=495146 RepID=UPI003081B894